jgi:hypothetical protein
MKKRWVPHGGTHPAALQADMKKWQLPLAARLINAKPGRQH